MTIEKIIKLFSPMLRNMFMKLYRMQLKRKYNEIKSKVPIQLKQSRKQRERNIFYDKNKDAVNIEHINWCVRVCVMLKMMLNI